MPTLGVNVDHIATVRQQRRGTTPDPVAAAVIAERAGADSIVCHLREDRRHIQDRDVTDLRRRIATRLNLEMSIAPEIVEQALHIRPQQVTLVPERREELTTEGGLDVVTHAALIRPVVERLREAGIAVNLFVDPEAQQLTWAKRVGATMVELHTGAYAAAGDDKTRACARQRLLEAAEIAHGLGLRVAAGHGLGYADTASIAELPHIEELNIGYAIVTHALMVGWEVAVRQMAHIVHGVEVMDGARLRC